MGDTYKLILEATQMRSVSKGHYGLGNFGSSIHDKNDIKKALPNIETVYSDKNS